MDIHKILHSWGQVATLSMVNEPCKQPTTNKMRGLSVSDVITCGSTPILTEISPMYMQRILCSIPGFISV